MADSSYRHALVSMLVLGTTAVNAGEWDYTPRLSTSILYSDNARLDAGEPQSDVIVQVRPGISVRGESARVNATLDYNLDKQESLNDVSNSSINHQLQAQGNGEIFEDHLFLDLRAVSTQFVRDNRNAVSFDDRIGAGLNETSVTSVGVSPYAQFRFGSFASTELRGRYNVVRNEGQQAFSNSTSLGGTLSVDSGADFAVTPWSLQIQSTEVELDNGTTNEFRQASFRFGYRWSRQWTTNVTVGYEDNTFSSISDTSGSSWTVGAVWTPNNRTSVDFSLGERFFGRTFNASADYQRRHTTFRLRYNERVDTANQFLSRFSATPQGDFQNIANLDPNAFSRIGIRTDTPNLNDQTFLNKRLDATVDWQRRRNGASIRFFRNSREDQGGIDPLFQKSNGITANFSRDLSRQLTAALRANWISNEFVNEDRSDDIVRIAPNLSYRWSEFINVRFEYANTRRTSTDANADFTENTVSLVLNLTL